MHFSQVGLQADRPQDLIVKGDTFFQNQPVILKPASLRGEIRGWARFGCPVPAVAGERLAVI